MSTSSYNYSHFNRTYTFSSILPFTGITFRSVHRVGCIFFMSGSRVPVVCKILVCSNKDIMRSMFLADECYMPLAYGENIYWIWQFFDERSKTTSSVSQCGIFPASSIIGVYVIPSDWISFLFRKYVLFQECLEAGARSTIWNFWMLVCSTLDFVVWQLLRFLSMWSLLPHYKQERG